MSKLDVSLQVPFASMMPHITRHCKERADIALLQDANAYRSGEGMSEALCRALSVMTILLAWLVQGNFAQGVSTQMHTNAGAKLQPDSCMGNGQNAGAKPVASQGSPFSLQHTDHPR